MMTKKTFVAVAATVAKIENLVARRAAAENFCVLFAKENPRFDRARFLAACGL
jgi:hypothetical protein